MVHSLPAVTMAAASALTRITTTPTRCQSVIFSASPNNVGAIFIFDASTGTVTPLTKCIGVVQVPGNVPAILTFTQYAPGGIDISQLYAAGTQNDILVVGFVRG